ncbi:MAG: hypothetical protein WDO73_32270 [Ignavibacteriota bacterium]
MWELPESIGRYSRADFGIPPDVFLFLYVFDLASSFERKNPLALVRAFRKALAADATSASC